MADDRRPKNEPTFDTQALLGVSDAELAEAGKRRAPPKKQVPWVFVAAGAGVVIVGAVVVAWLGSRSPDVVAVPLETPAASASAAPLEAAPDPGRTADPTPSAAAIVPAVTVPPSAPSGAPASAKPPRDARDPSPAEPRGRTKATDRGGKPSGPDAVDQALERLTTQTGDQYAAQGAWEAARTAYAAECAGGRAVSCTRWGALLLEGKGGEVDVGGARDALGTACRQRSPEGCLALARAVDGRAALEALEAACDLASAAGCRGAAEHIEKNGGGEAKVISLRARACALGDKASCATTATSTAD